MPRATLTRLREIFPQASPFLMYGLTEAFRSTYLDPAEVNVLAMLDAVEVTKTRRRWSHDGHAAAVDTYTGHLAGLVLAELNFADHASLLDYTPSPPLRCEVTNIAELTGPNLASLTPERLAAHLNTLRHRP